MKNSTIVKMTAALAIMMMGYASMFAQTTIPGISTTMSQYSSGTPGEDPDLVTKGTRVPYLVTPDHDLNPSYVLTTDGTSATNVVSTFSWNLGTIGTINNTPSNKHYVELNVTGNVSATPYILNVKENSGAGCSDGTGQNINIRIVAQPDVTAESVLDASSSTSTCAAGTNGSLNVAFPSFKVSPSIDGAISTPNIKVKATLTFTPLNGTASDVFSNKVLNVDASGNISNTDLGTALGASAFNKWGTYTLKVNYISDKISRKDIQTGKTDPQTDNGYFAPTTSISATYTIYKAPVTGPIYHILNNNAL